MDTNPTALPAFPYPVPRYLSNSYWSARVNVYRRLSAHTGEPAPAYWQSEMSLLRLLAVADRLAHLEVPGLLAWRDKVQEAVHALAPTGFAVGFTPPAGQSAPVEAQPAWDGAFEHVVTENVSVEPGTYLETSLLHDGLLMLKAALAIGRFACAPDSASYDETVTTTRYATSILEMVDDNGREALLEKWGLLPQPAQEQA